MPGKMIAQGAEAKLYRGSFQGQDALIKDRIRKSYRLPELDSKIRRLRTRREAGFIHRARRAGVSTPQIFSLEKDRIVMEYLEGERIKDVLNTSPKSKRELICRLIGEAAARLHSAGIMHGDLTTSNMILKKGRLFMIDFGLGKFSKRPEDYATDLFLLFEALKSTHFKYLNEAWQNILKAYCDNYSNSETVLQRFRKIGKRRRYKGE
jgi:TP53 regulating kinase-like protein